MFKKRRNKEHPVAEKAANKIAAAIIRVQTKVSIAVSNQLNKMPVKRLKFFLLLFCVSWGTLSIYFIVFDRKPKIQVEKIKMVHQPTDIESRPVDSGIIEQIHAYKHYMDSIGEPVRATLLDSMNLLEEIYLQQK
jgi:hypothetical protein